MTGLFAPFDDLVSDIEGLANELPPELRATGLLGGLGNQLRPAPNTVSRTTHGLSLRTKTGRVIGGVQSIGTPQAREVKVLREVDRRNHGRPAAVIPQALTTHTLVLERIDLHRAWMESALGGTSLVMLTDQYAGLRLREHWAGAAGTLFGTTTRYDFSGCYFIDLGRELASTADRISRARATLIWLSKDPLD